MPARDRVPSPLRLRQWLSLSAGIACLGWAAIAAPSLSAAESFGPPPKDDESRCAQMTISTHIVNIGDKIEASAGPATGNCGGPSSRVKWAWPNDDPDANEIPGLVKTHPCPGNSSHCEFKARLFTQAGVWEGICITGVAPQGAWTSCSSYAIRIGSYYLLTGTIFNLPGGKPLKVNVSGPGGRQSTTTDDAGVWRFAVKRGTYAISFSAHHKTIKHTAKVHGKPGTSVVLNIVA